MQENDRPGESAEAILDGDAFTIPVEFLTNDRRTEFTFKSKCNRKPKTVSVTLKRNDPAGRNDEEYDHVSFEFPRDFSADDSKRNFSRFDVILNRQQP